MLIMVQQSPTQGRHSYSSRSRISCCATSPLLAATCPAYGYCHLPQLFLLSQQKAIPTMTEPSSSSDSCCYHMTSTTPWYHHPHQQHVTSHCSLLLLLYQSSILSPAISIKLWYLDFISHHDTHPLSSFIVTHQSITWWGSLSIATENTGSQHSLSLQIGIKQASIIHHSE